jgi:hypothetical protein
VKKTIEMRFHGPAIHPYNGRNFRVTAALQKQINDLLLARTQPDRSLLTHRPPRLPKPTY